MADTQTGWPYDAVQDDPLTALRIPVVRSAHPEWNYIGAFDGSSLERPTDAEAATLASFLSEYVEHWYNDTWKLKMAGRPFDIDGGANGVVFRMYGEDDWGYRRRSWSMGPLYVPQSPRLREIDRSELGPLGLVRVMDRCHTIVDEIMPRWVEWKAQHPEVFGD